ncbi:MAG TPA: hypothetical protein VIH93_07865, partial [Thermoanaerobaculia bacterium]
MLERRTSSVAVVVYLSLAAGAAAVTAWPVPPEGKQEPRAQEKTLVCRFVGQFEEIGFLDEGAQAIVLDKIDPRFALVVRVGEVKDGKLPEGSREQLTFGLHSPSLFFAGQGISLPGFLKPPAGAYLFSLWRLPKENGF